MKTWKCEGLQLGYLSVLQRGEKGFYYECGFGPIEGNGSYSRDYYCAAFAKSAGIRQLETWLKDLIRDAKRSLAALERVRAEDDDLVAYRNKLAELIKQRDQQKLEPSSSGDK